MAAKSTEIRIFNYGDSTSLTALWWKVFLLMPIWGCIPAAILGAIAFRIGGMAPNIGFAIVLVSFAAYFFEDVLKTKIKVVDGILYHGFRQFPLNKLSTLKVEYEEQRLVPRALVLNFQNNDRLDLMLSRIEPDDVNYLVKLIESHFPHCTIDPVLRTLSRCHDLSAQLNVGSSGQVIEIPYNPHRFLRDSAKSFLDSLSSWRRMGPIVCWALTTPMWLNFAYGVYKTSISTKDISLLEALSKQVSDFYHAFGEVINKVGPVLYDGMSNPIFAIASLLIAFFAVSQTVKTIGQPTLVIVDPDAVRLFISWRLVRYEVLVMPWKDLRRVEITKPGEDASPETWKLSFQCSNSKNNIALDWAGLTPEGRAAIYEHAKRYATGCTMSPELAETMLRKQNASYTELWLQSLSGSPKRNNLDPLGPGHKLNENRYEVLNKLGEGGQGAAYLCAENSMIDMRSCQEVVLKESIFPIFVDSTIRREALERFEHEARTLNALSHDNIVKLMDYFVEDHRGYLVLEHIQGRNLRDTAGGSPLDEEKVLDLALQMCEMLSYLHSKNVIHRDFTPDNLILETTGTLKLIDFNVAQTVNTGMTGTVVGKHAYVPPEQFRGKPTAESDVYAMGCTLFYLLSGHDPAPITQSKIGKERSDVSAGLQAIIEKCTNLKSENRYASIDELKLDLQRAKMGGESSSASIEPKDSESEPPASENNSDSVVSESSNGDSQNNGDSGSHKLKVPEQRIAEPILASSTESEEGSDA